ncbi:hypothetical protein ACHAXS_006394 [Conticribra weissflogii]
MRIVTILTGFAASVIASSAQDQYGDYGDYQDYADGYEQDSLYQDYAMRQQEKGEGGGGIGIGKVIFSSTLTYFLGAKIHSGRVAKKLKKKHQQDQKALYTQYYNDVYKLEEQKAEQQYLIDQHQGTLQQTNEKHEMEALQREYDEFKQPDVDGDDRISRAEFNMYVKNYLSNYPGLTEKDYPKFEDFDRDGDGYVSFQEYAEQMAVQAQQAELEQYYAQSQGQSGQKQATKANALYDLYGSASQSDGFNDLYAQFRR